MAARSGWGSGLAAFVPRSADRCGARAADARPVAEAATALRLPAGAPVIGAPVVEAAPMPVPVSTVASAGGAAPSVGSALTVGSAHDPAEAQADRMSLTVLQRLGRSAGAAPAVRRLAEPEVGAQGGPVSAGTRTAIERLRGTGRPLPVPVRTRMEDAFGADFSDVRVHTGPAAQTLNRQIGARAFTTGSDVVLGDTSVHGGSADDDRVLAHELTHVLQNRGDGALSRVRRLVGFEVEVSVPITSRGASAPVKAVESDQGTGPKPDVAIGAFFTGAPAYGTVIGQLPWETGRTIEMSTDHNVMRQAGAALFDEIADRYPDTLAGVEHIDLANLEYGTPALDELADGSNERFKSLAVAIDQHVAGIMTGKPAEKISVLAHSKTHAVGIPVPQLRAWLELDRYGEKEIEEKLAALQRTVRWSMYIQATVGVLPTGLATMYESQADDLPSTRGRAPSPLKDAANAVVAMSKRVEAQSFLAEFAAGHDEGKDEADRFTEGDLAAVRGLLTLATSYAIGNVLGQTGLLGGTQKNAVQLLSKLEDIGEVSKAAPDRLRKLRGQEELEYLRTFVAAAAAWIHTAPQTGLAYWLAPPYRSKKLKSRGRIYGAESGLSTVAATERLLLDLFTGSSTAGAIASGNALRKPDPRPAAAGPAGGQRGIPLELRWIKAKPTAAGQLWPVFKSVLDQTRAANLAHRNEDSRETILDRM